MTSVTLETLGLQGPRTRAGTPNHEEIIAELQTQLQEAQTAISNNLDTVSDQIEILNGALSSYNHLNPPAIAETPQQPPAGDQRPPATTNTKYDPKDSFLGSMKGRPKFSRVLEQSNHFRTTRHHRRV